MKRFNLFGLLTLGAILMLSCSEDPLVDEPSKSSEYNLLKAASNDGNLVVNGPETFSQVPWSDNYVIPGESVPIPGDHTLDVENPILSEQDMYSDFVSNIPLDITVYDNMASSEWYGKYHYNFVNRSDQPVHLDCTVIIFKAPSGSNMDHHYWNSQAFGHPQQDYVEVPIDGTNDSWYIARLVFHDVPENARTLYPGEEWEYQIGVPTNPYNSPAEISPEDSKYTVRVIADLTGNKNEDLVRKYGTKRYRN